MEVPHLEALYKKYSDQGLVILGASVDQDYESLRQVVQREISYPVLRDRVMLPSFTGSGGYQLIFISIGWERLVKLKSASMGNWLLRIILRIYYKNGESRLLGRYRLDKYM